MSQKYALITGCSAGGVGHGFALEFLKHNIHVFATARTVSKMSGLSSLSNITLLELDVTSAESVASVAEKVNAITNGRLDYLVNNAGIAIVKPIMEVEIEEAQRVFDTNYWGTFRMTKAFLPSLMEAKGCVINIGTIASELCAPWTSSYAASKAALKVFTESLRYEMSVFGIRTICVMAGAIDTEFGIHQPMYHAPPDSLFTSMESYMQRVCRGEFDFPTSKVDVFVGKVVKDALGGANGPIWRGAMASITRIVISLPQFIIDIAVAAGGQLNVLKKAVKEGKTI